MNNPIKLKQEVKMKKNKEEIINKLREAFDTASAKEVPIIQSAIIKTKENIKLSKEEKEFLEYCQER